MLAGPLQSTSAFGEHTDIATQYRPAKDLQAFNALLPPAIEFVKGSSTGTIATSDGKYQPINAPKEENPNVSTSRTMVVVFELKPTSSSHRL
jgi:ubiquitin carboxyl-terminal hydrolase 36/42